MDRTNDILNGIKTFMSESAEMYGGKKRSELKDSDFLFPETRSFPIVIPADVPDAINNFGRMKGPMTYDAFLKKLYNKVKNKGPEFVAALPEATKERLGLKKKVEANDEEYRQSFYDMSVGSLRAIMEHAKDILDNLENSMVQQNLTAPHLQGMIAVAEDHMRSIHDFVMYVEFEVEDENEDEEEDMDEEEDNEEMMEEESKVEPVTKVKKKTKKVSIKDLPHYTFVPKTELIQTPVEADSYNDINMFELGPSTMKNLDDLYGDDEENTKLNDTNALKKMMEIYANINQMMEKISDPLVRQRLTQAMKRVRMSGMVEAMKRFEDVLMFLPLADDDKTMIASDKQVDTDQKTFTPTPDTTTMSQDRPGLWENIRKKKERMGKKYKPAQPGDKDRPDPEQWKKLTDK